MYEDEQKAFNQGIDDAHKGIEEDQEKYKNKMLQMEYIAGYAFAKQNITGYYHKQQLGNPK